MKVYVAGPMTGKPNHNFEAFNAAAQRLTEWGHEVVNPAALDAPGVTHEELDALPPEWYYRRDIGYMLGFLGTPYPCDAILLLPGWASSTGASYEHHTAIVHKMKVYDSTNEMELSHAT